MVVRILENTLVPFMLHKILEYAGYESNLFITMIGYSIVMIITGAYNDIVKVSIVVRDTDNIRKSKKFDTARLGFVARAVLVVLFITAALLSNIF